MQNPLFITMLTLLSASTAAMAAPTLPNDFEQPTNAIGPMFAYFGGVTNWGTTPSSQLVYSGNSLEVWADLVNDSFAVAGFAVGTFGISSPGLNVPANGNTFSVTVKSPASGQLSMNVLLREDDNNDGQIRVQEDDDEWESGILLLDPGTNVYNFALSSFIDTDTDAGNNVQNFTTTGRLAYIFVFESRDAYPGGQVVGHVSLHVDHAGIYAGPQTMPGPATPGDLDGNGVVDVTDLFNLLSQWGMCNPCPSGCTADISNGSGPGSDCNVNVSDLFLLLSNWG